MTFYMGAACRSLRSAIDWLNRSGVWFGVICIVGGVLFRVVVMNWWPLLGDGRPRFWTVLGEFGVVAAAGLLIGFIIVTFVFFIADPVREIRLRDERITQLGGAPDKPIRIPSLSGTDADATANAIGVLSGLVNGDAQDAYDRALTALSCIQNIRTATASVCAVKVDDAFSRTRELLRRLLGTSAATGLLNAGDPVILAVLNQAIQQIDRQIIIDFDDYGRRAKNVLYFLSMVETSEDERRRLFEPAMHLADHDLNGWDAATQRFGEFLNKTNKRIGEIRQQILK